MKASGYIVTGALGREGQASSQEGSAAVSASHLGSGCTDGYSALILTVFTGIACWVLTAEEGSGKGLEELHADQTCS